MSGDDVFARLRNLAADGGPAATTHRYGDLPDQLADLRLPAGEGEFPVAILLHGGFWRARWSRDLMEAMAADLARRGWASWNVEYRRVGAGGGVPETLDDVDAAWALLDRLEAPIDHARVVAIGHSAGGHLALWLASRRRLRLVVSLAGVSNLAEAARLGIGSDAVREFCGGLPDEVPAAYERADPFERLPLGVPQLIVHGDRDDRVPVDLSTWWARRAVECGDRCELVVLPGTDHFDLIDPTTGAWRETAKRLPG